MELSKTIYALKRVRNMCVAFDDTNSIDAIDTAMILIESKMAETKERNIALVKVRPEPGYKGADMHRRY